MPPTRTTGKHRRPSRRGIRPARVAGMATLATSGVAATLASP
ncbi:M23 family peptidase, partial [Streptomyces sp. SID5475]|nr:M23 family peptidase [Streptomyces sp. SID5475]